MGLQDVLGRFAASVVVVELRRKSLSKRGFQLVAGLLPRFRADFSLPARTSLFADEEILRRLLFHAAGAAHRNAQEGAVLAEVAVISAARCRRRNLPEMRWMRLEADARFEFAEMLLRSGNAARTRVQALRARALYHRPSVRRLLTNELARLDLTLGQAVYAEGDREAGARILARGGDYYREVGNVAKFTQARIIFAAVLMRDSQYGDALAVLEEAMPGATEVDDLTLGMILHNICVCRAELGLPVSEQALQAARAKFDQHRLHTEVLRCDALRAIVLRRSDRRKEAVSAMYKVRNGFRSLGLPIVGARQSMEIVRWLVEDGEYAEAVELAEGEREQLIAGHLMAEASALDELVRAARAHL